MSIRLLSVMSPLLDDSRLTIPEKKVAVKSMANALARTNPLPMKSIPQPAVAAAPAPRGSLAHIQQNALTSSGQPVNPLPTPTAAPAPISPAGNPAAMQQVQSRAQAANTATAAKPTLPSVGPSNMLQNLTRFQGLRYGAGLGAIKGLVDPGTYTDENGNTQQKSRVGAMLGNAAIGGTIGAVGTPMIRGGAKWHAASEAAKTSSILPVVGPTLKSASAPGNLDATTNPMIAGVPTRSGDNGDSGGQITMDASTAKISAKAEKNTLDASMNASIDDKDKKPGSKPFELPSLNLSKNQPKKK